MGTLKLILTLVGGVVFFALILVIARFFDEKGAMKWLKAAIGMCAFVAANLLAPIAPAALGLLTIILPLGCYVYLFVWWSQEGSSIKELIFFLLISSMLYSTTMAGMARVLDLSSNWVVRGLMMSFPSIVSIMLCAFMVSNMIAFKQEMNAMLSESEEGGDEDEDDEEFEY